MADQVIEDMPSDVVIASRQLTSPLHEKIATIQNTPEFHRTLKVLDKFDLPVQKGKAYQQKQNMTNTYGNRPEILGFSFVVTTSTDSKHQYLGVTFDPEKIVDGVYEEWEAEREEKAAAAAERKAERELKAAAKAEIAALEDDGDDD